MKTKILLSIIATNIASSTALLAEDEIAPERPSPESLVADMIVNHDSDQNGSLDKNELGAALEQLRMHHREKMKGMREKRKEKVADSDRPERSDRKRKDKGERDPAKRIEHMISRFDQDSDGSLDSKELLALVDRMHDRRENRRGPGGPPPPPEDEI